MTKKPEVPGRKAPPLTEDEIEELSKNLAKGMTDPEARDRADKASEELFEAMLKAGGRIRKKPPGAGGKA